MKIAYHCPFCKIGHGFDDDTGQRHLKKALSKKDVERFIDFASNAGAHGYITANTQQYVRDVEVFGLLKTKFHRAGMFDSPESAKAWLDQHLSQGHNNHILRRLQGDGGGEVDALRQLNSSWDRLLYETKFPTGIDGHVPSNYPGIDLIKTNRFTGEIVEKIQVKSNWSSDPEIRKQTLERFVGSKEYNPDITLAGPKELIQQAKEMGLQNKLVIVSDVNGNRISGERLRELAQEKDASLEGVITLQGATEKIGQGAVIGAGVMVGISALSNFIAYRQGRVTGAQAFRNIGIDAGRGSVTGAAMGGLSLLFPPGFAGIAIGVAVGMQVRKITDIAFGKGAYKDILDSMGAVQATIKTTAQGIAIVDQMNTCTRDAQEQATIDLLEAAEISENTDSMIERMKQFRKGKKRLDD